MNYEKLARSYARKYGLDPNVFVRQIRQESGFNPKARSPAGATGIAQIMPATAKGWGVNPNDPKASLNAAAKNMASYVKKYGSYENALRAYNAGPGNIKASKGFGETNNYVKTILGGKDPGKLGGASSGGLEEGGAVGGGGPDRRMLAQYLLGGSHDMSLLAAAMRGGGSEAVPKAAGGTQSTSPTGKASDLKELFYDPQGGWKNGQRIGAIGGHSDHVHVAVPRSQVKRVGLLAQKMGLHVGENDIFAGKNPTGGHAPNSNHYKGLALDVSGNPKQMARFARKVRRLYGTS